MKNLLYLFLFLPLFAISQINATIDSNGKKVILNSDGTWQFDNSKSVEQKTTLPNTTDTEFTWKMGDDSYKKVSFIYGIKDEIIDKKILDQVVMNVLVQAKFKLKIKNSFVAKRLMILKTDYGYTASVLYLGKNAYGTEMEQTTYFSFTNEDPTSIKETFTK